MSDTPSSAPAQITPHRARRAGLPAGGTHLAALQAFPTSHEPLATALLLPGYTGSKEDFAPLLDALADGGFHVVAVDLPGQYESPGPPLERDYLPGPLGRTVAALVTELAGHGRRVLLLGHSYGGLVARGAVLAGAPVSGLTLLGSGPGALPAGPRRSTLDLGEPLLREHGVEAVQRFREASNGVPEPAALANLLRARFLGSAVPGLLGMAAALRTEPDRTAELATALHAAAAGCLVACGQDDDAWPLPTQREMAGRLAAEFAVVAGAGHSPAVENPAGLLGVLLPVWQRWLR